MKKIIMASIMSAVIFSGITAFAVTNYNSDQVLYKKGNENITLTNAIDDLYSKASSKGELKKVLLGSSTGTYDLTSYEDYNSFSNDNFAIEIVSATGSIWYSGRADMGSNKNGSLSFSKNYNSETGSLTISSSGNTTLYVTAYGETNSDATFGANINVYLYYVE